MNGEIRALFRKNEKLPIVLIENGNAVYCRMTCCDFRFPLPKSSRVKQAILTEGGADTVDGFVDVETTNGSPVDLDAYSSQLNNYHLAEGGWVSPASESEKGVVRIKFSYFGDY
ncbi:MAG TPA: hypothetical protein VH280_15150 [Verrucomicrobiae bacterium]|jgi:hypothetical protein|nr:hypothetical protein [Verrucomicrobiae bacterium]